MKKSVYIKIVRTGAWVVPQFLMMTTTFHYLFAWTFFDSTRSNKILPLLAITLVLLCCTVVVGYWVRRRLGLKVMKFHEARQLSWREFFLWQSMPADTVNAQHLLYFACYSAIGGAMAGALMVLLAYLMA